MTQLAAPPSNPTPLPRVGKSGTSLPGVNAKLQSLRRRITIWFLCDGLVRLVWCAIALVAIDLLLDWTFAMDRAQRAVMLVLGIATLGAVAYYFLIRPLSVHFSDDALCQQVESRHKELGQSLISAVQFARMDQDTVDANRVSPAMIRATIKQGSQRAEQVRFADVLCEWRFYRNVVMLTLAILGFGLVAVTVAKDQPMRIWFDRNILLGDSLWPQDYRFEIEGVQDGKLVSPRGDDWPLAVTVMADNAQLPPADQLEMEVDIRSQRDRRFETMERDVSDYHYRLPLKNVLEEFRFQVRAGRSYSPWIDVRLIDRPEVAELTLSVVPPSYTGRGEEPLPEGRGPYYVLKGSKLRIRGQGSKPLSGATLLVGDLLLPMQLVGADAAGGKDTKLKQGQPTDRFALDLPPEQLAAGTYRIDLLDTEKLVMPGQTEPGPLQSKRPTPFSIRLAADGEPQVKVTLSGIGGMVVPGARVPCEVRISDDYAVRNVRLGYEYRSDVQDSQQAEGTIVIDSVADQLGQQLIKFDHLFELAPLKIPTGTTLKFVFQADDNDDISGPKTGTSTALLLRVVTEDELRADLLRREKEQRQEFERLLDQQDDLYTESAAMLAATRGQADLPADQRGLLVKLQKRQKLLAVNTGGVAERLAAVLLELQNNGLEEPGGPLQKRLQERIVGPIERLSLAAMPAAAASLDETRRLAQQAEPRNAALAKAVDQQQAIADEMREILRHMVKSEGYQEAINLLYEIERQQQDLLKMTEEERQERIRELLEKRGAKPEPEDDSEDKPENSPEKSPQPPEKEPAAGDKPAPETPKDES